MAEKDNAHDSEETVEVVIRGESCLENSFARGSDKGVDYLNEQMHTDPGKWQLVIVITVAVWLVELSGMYLFRDFLSRGGWLSANAVNFLSLCANLFVLFYCFIEVLTPLLTFQVGKKKYGFGPFMVYRMKWIRGQKHWFMEVLESAVVFLEEGLLSFDTPPSESVANDEANYLSEEEQLGPPIIMRVVRSIKIDSLQEYKNWLKRETSEMLVYQGENFGQNSSLPNKASDSTRRQTSQQASRQSLAFGRISLSWELGDEDANDAQDNMQSIASEEDFEIVGPKIISHVSNAKFPNAYKLQFWLASLERYELLKQLKQIQESPDETSFRKCSWLEKSKAERLPSKWKLWMINNIGFYFAIVWGTNYFEPHYNEKWLANVDNYWWRALVNITVVNFVGFYITTPFFEMIFSYWLVRKPHELTNREPWRSLNDGFQCYWLKVTILLVMYGGLLIWRASVGDWGTPDASNAGAYFWDPELATM